jgi:hypothetical protein
MYKQPHTQALVRFISTDCFCSRQAHKGYVNRLQIICLGEKMSKSMIASAFMLAALANNAVAAEELNAADKCILAPFNDLAADMQDIADYGTYILTFDKDDIQPLIKSCEEQEQMEPNIYKDAGKFEYKKGSFTFRAR